MSLHCADGLVESADLLAASLGALRAVIVQMDIKVCLGKGVCEVCVYGGK